MNLPTSSLWLLVATFSNMLHFCIFGSYQEPVKIERFYCGSVKNGFTQTYLKTKSFFVAIPVKQDVFLGALKCGPLCFRSLIVMIFAWLVVIFKIRIS